MNTWMIFEAVVLFVPALALLGLGMMVSLRSGVANLTTGTGLRQFLGNLSSTFLIIGAMLFALRVAQRLAGFRIWVDW